MGQNLVTQLLDVGAFQKYKREFKKLIEKEVFHEAREITKADFFALFSKFSTKTFTPALCKAAFRKTDLVPFDPSVVLLKMKEYGGIQETKEKSPSDDEDEDEDEDSEPAFRTPPPPSWSEFNTLITNTARRRGAQYVKGRMLAGEITPTVVRVQEKVEKAADQMILKGQLSTELLATNNPKEEERRARNDAANKVVQKYGEIYGHVARRQIAEDEEDEKRVVNMREKRLAEPYRKRYRQLMAKFPMLYQKARDQGQFIWCTTD